MIIFIDYRNVMCLSGNSQNHQIYLQTEDKTEDLDCKIKGLSQKTKAKTSRDIAIDNKFFTTYNYIV